VQSFPCGIYYRTFRVSSNVINATGIRPHPLLAHVRLILQQDPAALLHSIDLLPGRLEDLSRIPPPTVCDRSFDYRVFVYNSAGKTKGAVGYLLKFDHILIAAIAKGCDK
jgi:hypothetical protein